jgi:hypothetical protein
MFPSIRDSFQEMILLFLLNTKKEIKTPSLSKIKKETKTNKIIRESVSICLNFL